MKKLLFIPLLLFGFGISTVSADNVFTVDIDSTMFSNIITYYNEHSSEVDSLISYYEANYANAYPYYYVYLVTSNSGTSLQLYYTASPNTLYSDTYNRPLLITNAWSRPNQNTLYRPYRMIYMLNGVPTDWDPDSTTGYNPGGLIVRSFSGDANEYVYNISLINHGHKYGPDINYYSVVYDKIHFNSFTVNNVSYNSFDVYPGDSIPDVLSLYNGTYSPDNVGSFTTIDLNDYAYVALSLKNYSNTNPIQTNIYTKGQLCSTRVYDYGRSDAFNPSVGDYAQECTVEYVDFTPVRFSIRSQEIENDSIWYIKAYNTNIDNIIKVDPTVFDVSYVSFADASNPIITVDGVNYHSIPFDNLSSTANSSTSNGIASGQVVSLFDSDLNSTSFENLFKNPLSTLGTVWTSVMTMFTVIGTFIGLLPPVLQGFLVFAFSVGIILGIFKIIM